MGNQLHCQSNDHERMLTRKGVSQDTHGLLVTMRNQEGPTCAVDPGYLWGRCKPNLLWGLHKKTHQAFAVQLGGWQLMLIVILCHHCAHLLRWLDNTGLTCRHLSGAWTPWRQQLRIQVKFKRVLIQETGLKQRLRQTSKHTVCIFNGRELFCLPSGILEPLRKATVIVVKPYHEEPPSSTWSEALQTQKYNQHSAWRHRKPHNAHGLETDQPPPAEAPAAGALAFARSTTSSRSRPSGLFSPASRPALDDGWHGGEMQKTCA